MATPVTASSSDQKHHNKDLRRKLRRLKIQRDAVKELGVELDHGAFAKVVLLEVYGMRCAGKRLPLGQGIHWIMYM